MEGAGGEVYGLRSRGGSLDIKTGRFGTAGPVALSIDKGYLDFNNPRHISLPDGILLHIIPSSSDTSDQPFR